MELDSNPSVKCSYAFHQTGGKALGFYCFIFFLVVCNQNIFFISAVSPSPTFWAGTNSGAIYVFALHVPDYSMRQTQEVNSVLGK